MYAFSAFVVLVKIAPVRFAYCREVYPAAAPVVPKSAPVKFAFVRFA